MDHIYKEKKILRHQYRKIRKEISPKRRKEAEDIGEQKLISMAENLCNINRTSETISSNEIISSNETINSNETVISNTGLYILSYSSIQDEFCLQGFNAFIASKNFLVLPKIVEDKIHIFHVRDIEKDLILNKLGILEPDSSLCEEVSISELAFIIVPALAFDEAHHRLGYGGGFYDRFLLTDLQKPPKTIGLGFKEQLHSRLLPVTPNDITLDEVLLF